jgi:hypothetical protein
MFSRESKTMMVEKDNTVFDIKTLVPGLIFILFFGTWKIRPVSNYGMEH